MFYCGECGKKNGWREGLFQSVGPCEVCGKTRECSSVPSRYLPSPRDMAQLEIPLAPLVTTDKNGNPLKRSSS